MPIDFTIPTYHGDTASSKPDVLRLKDATQAALNASVGDVSKVANLETFVVRLEGAGDVRFGLFTAPYDLEFDASADPDAETGAWISARTNLTGTDLFTAITPQHTGVVFAEVADTATLKTVLANASIPFDFSLSIDGAENFLVPAGTMVLVTLEGDTLGGAADATVTILARRTPN